MKILAISFLIIFCFTQETNGNTKALEGQLKEAQDIMNKGNIQEALSKFHQIIKNHPNSQQQILEKAILNIAICYAKLGNYDEALAKYEEFSKRFPKSKIMDCYFNELSDYYYRINNYDKSIELSQKLIEKFPKSDLVKYALMRQGDLYYIKKDYEKALEMYKEAMIKDPTDEKIIRDCQLFSGYCYYYLNDYKKAIDELQKFLNKYQNFKVQEVKFWLAFSLQKEGLYSKAIEVYKDLLRNYPNYNIINDVLYNLWCCYHYKKDYDSAIATLQWFIKTPPKSQYYLDFGHHLIAVTYSKKARFAENPFEALSNFNKAILEVIKSRGYALRYTLFVVILKDFGHSSLHWKFMQAIVILLGLLSLFNYKKTKCPSHIFYFGAYAFMIVASIISPLYVHKFGLKSMPIAIIFAVIPITLFYFGAKAKKKKVPHEQS